MSNSGVIQRFLNVRETAQYMGLDVDTVYKKARLRELPSVKVGRVLRVDLKAFEAYVEQGTIQTIATIYCLFTRKEIESTKSAGEKEDETGACVFTVLTNSRRESFTRSWQCEPKTGTWIFGEKSTFGWGL